MKRNRLKELYYLISEPRSIRVSYAAIYLCLCGAGLSVVLNNPTTFSMSVDDLLTFMCGAFCALGGIVGVGFVLTQLWAWERIGAVLCGTGLLSYLLISLWAEFVLHSDGNPIPTAFLIAALLVAIIMRWVTLRRAEVVATTALTAE